MHPFCSDNKQKSTIDNNKKCCALTLEHRNIQIRQRQSEFLHRNANARCKMSLTYYRNRVNILWSM